jgi:hypothetical protein
MVVRGDEICIAVGVEVAGRHDGGVVVEPLRAPLAEKRSVRDDVGARWISPVGLEEICCPVAVQIARQQRPERASRGGRVGDLQRRIGSGRGAAEIDPHAVTALALHADRQIRESVTVQIAQPPQPAETGPPEGGRRCVSPNGPTGRDRKGGAAKIDKHGVGVRSLGGHCQVRITVAVEVLSLAPDVDVVGA